MNSTQMITAIKTALATALPGRLATASLVDFDEYTEGPPTTAEKKSLSVYLSEEADSTDFYSVQFIVQAQLYKEKDTQGYHEVIFQAIRELITPQLLGLETRERIDADIYPLDRNVGASFAFYVLDFQSNLDDCDY